MTVTVITAGGQIDVDSPHSNPRDAIRAVRRAIQRGVILKCDNGNTVLIEPQAALG